MCIITVKHIAINEICFVEFFPFMLLPSLFTFMMTSKLVCDDFICIIVYSLMSYVHDYTVTQEMDWNFTYTKKNGRKIYENSAGKKIVGLNLWIFFWGHGECEWPLMF